MVNYERRGRAQLLDEDTRKRYEILYGGKSNEQEDKKVQPALA